MKKVTLGPQTFLYPLPALLVGTKVDDTPNFMTAAWCAIAASKPAAASVAIRKDRHTLKGVEQQGTFSLNVPSAALAKKVDYCGIYSGKKRDKSHIFQIFYGVLKTAPLVQECPVNLECKVIHSLDLGSHNLIVGEIIETHVSENCVTDGKPNPKMIDPLIYAAGTSEYYRFGDIIGKAFNIGKD